MLVLMTVRSIVYAYVTHYFRSFVAAGLFEIGGRLDNYCRLVNDLYTET